MTKSRKRRGKKNATGSKIPQNYIWLALTAIVVVIAGALLWPQPANACETIEDFVPEVTGGPRVSVLQDVVNHGNVKLNTTVESVFTIANVGDEDLLILGVPQIETIEGC